MFCLDRAGVVGDDGPSHHGAFDLSYLRFIPNIIVMAPKDEEELQHMLFTAIHHNGPAAVRYPRGSGCGVALANQLKKLTIGRGELMLEGDDVLLLPIGNRVYPALEAAGGLKKVGINAAVINPRFIKPLDAELICSWAKKCGRVVTIEDNVPGHSTLSRFKKELADHGALKSLEKDFEAQLKLNHLSIEPGKGRIDAKILMK